MHQNALILSFRRTKVDATRLEHPRRSAQTWSVNGNLAPKQNPSSNELTPPTLTARGSRRTTRDPGSPARCPAPLVGSGVAAVVTPEPRQYY